MQDTCEKTRGAELARTADAPRQMTLVRRIGGSQRNVRWSAADAGAERRQEGSPELNANADAIVLIVCVSLIYRGHSGVVGGKQSERRGGEEEEGRLGRGKGEQRGGIGTYGGVKGREKAKTNECIGWAREG